MTHRGLARTPGWLAAAVVLVVAVAFPSSAAADPTLPVIVETNLAPQQQGSTFSGQVAHFYAGNVPSWTATIDWGDGTPVDTTATATNYSGCVPYVTSLSSDCGQTPNPQSNGGFVTGTHTFARPGPYNITVSLSGFYQAGNGKFPPPRTHATTAQGVIPGSSAACPILASLGFAKLQLLGGGCISNNGTQQTTPAGVPVVVNGLELHPASGVSLTLDSSAGTLSSGTGNVTMDLGCGPCGQHQTQFKPKPINWRVVANPGEGSIDEGSTGRFAVSIGGLLMDLPALSLNSIKLLQDQSDVSFTVGLPLKGFAKFFGEIKATATMRSDNTTGAHFDGLDAEIGASQTPQTKGVTVTAPFKAFFGHLKFSLGADTWDVSLTFSVPGAGGIAASTQVVRGVPTDVHFAASYLTPGLAIGDTGVFLQKVSGGFTDYPHVHRPRIGVIQFTGDQSTDDARKAECANIDTYYDQFIALNRAFPSYCGQVGSLDFDPPLEVDGDVQLSAGPVIGRNSALLINGGFRFVNSYFDGSNDVPWEFNVHGSVTMGGLPFNRSTIQVYQTGTYQKKTGFAPVNNSGTTAWATLHGDGLVEAGGGFDYAFPQNSPDWFIKLSGDIGLKLIPAGAAIGSPQGGETAQQYANVVKAHANHFTVLGTVTGSICAQIPSVASGCAMGVGGISNNGVAGCASFTIPGSQVLQALAIYGAEAINAIAEFGQQAATSVLATSQILGDKATQAAADTSKYLSDIAKSTADGASKAGGTLASGATSTWNSVASFLHIAGDQPSSDIAPRARAAAAPRAHAAGDVVSTNITIPNVNYAIGATYLWSGDVFPLTSCSVDVITSALSARDVAHASSARGVPSAQIRVGRSRPGRMFVLTGVSSSPDVIVMGPDRRAIRTKGWGFITPGWIVYKDPKHKTTYVEAFAAPAGKWDFVAVPGSSRIAKIQTGGTFKIPTVRASVRPGKHRRFSVAYRIFGRSRGYTVTLEEMDGSGGVIKIAKLNGTKGTLSWAPSARLPSAKRVLFAVIQRGRTVISTQPIGGLNLKTLAKNKPKPKPPVDNESQSLDLGAQLGATPF